MRILCLAAATALLLVGAGSAEAAVRFNLTGVVTSGSDDGYIYPGLGPPFGSTSFGVNLNTGQIFGSPAGQSFSLAITLDETKGTRDAFPLVISQYGRDAEMPATAEFTLNGFTYALGAVPGATGTSGVEKYNRSIAQGSDAFGAFIETERLRPPMNGAFTNQTGLLSLGFRLPASTFSNLDFAEPAQWTRAGDEVATGRFQITLQNTEGSPALAVAGPTRTAQLNLRFDSFSVATIADTLPLAPVPEPSTWAMMIAGFGLAGAALRRRRLALRHAI